MSCAAVGFIVCSLIAAACRAVCMGLSPTMPVLVISRLLLVQPPRSSGHPDVRATLRNSLLARGTRRISRKVQLGGVVGCVVGCGGRVTRTAAGQQDSGERL